MTWRRRPIAGPRCHQGGSTPPGVGVATVGRSSPHPCAGPPAGLLLVGRDVAGSLVVQSAEGGKPEMLITLTWLRLDGLRRWRSLAVLALLIALATATVLTSIGGARRGQTAFDRPWGRPLPSNP